MKDKGRLSIRSAGKVLLNNIALETPLKIVFRFSVSANSIRISNPPSCFGSLLTPHTQLDTLYQYHQAASDAKHGLQFVHPPQELHL